MASPTQSIAARNRQAHDARSPAVRKTLAVVLVLNAIVLVIKIVVGVRTGALTVLGAALESGLDVLNNVIGIALVAVASRAPDEDHPYGHDKFETLGALGIVGFLSISCFELLREGADALLAAPATASRRVWSTSRSSSERSSSTCSSSGTSAGAAASSAASFSWPTPRTPAATFSSRSWRSDRSRSPASAGRVSTPHSRSASR